MNPVIRRSGIPAGLVLILLAAGCSSGEAGGGATSAGTLPAPSVALETYTGDGFEMLLPAGWLVATPDDADFGALLEGSGGAFAPSSAEALEQQVATLFRQGGRLFAFDIVNARPDFVDNINIISMPAGGFEAARIESVTVEQLRNRLGATAVESAIRAVPAGEAVIISYRLPAPASEGVSVTLLTETGHWALTLTMQELGSMRYDFVTMIESFRELP